MSDEPLPTEPGHEPMYQPEPTPLLQLLQLPGLPAPTGDAPVCGPDGCAVPQPGTGPAEADRDR